MLFHTAAEGSTFGWRKSPVLGLYARLQEPPPLCAGHLQTLVSVDARQVPNFFVSTHALISLPLQLLATLVVLWWQVQAAFVAGLLPVIALIPVNRLLSCTISTASQRMMGHKDRRLDVMSTLLHNLRSLFMLGWQQEIHKQVPARLALSVPLGFVLLYSNMLQHLMLACCQ